MAKVMKSNCIIFGERLVYQPKMPIRTLVVVAPSLHELWKVEIYPKGVAVEVTGN